MESGSITDETLGSYITMQKKKLVIILALIAIIALCFGGGSDEDNAVDLLIDRHMIQTKEDLNSPQSVEAFCNAIYEGNMEIAEAFCKAGINVNAENEDYLAPLALAAFRGDDSFLKLLLDAGANVNVSSWHSPLLQAAANGHVECVRLLIKAGADVNERDDTKSNHQHKTPLMWAASEGHAECVKLLLEAGADVSIQSYHGTALSYALGAGRCEHHRVLPGFMDWSEDMPLVYVPSSTKCVKLLIARQDKCVCYGEMLDYYTIGKGSEECAKILRAAGAK